MAEYGNGAHESTLDGPDGRWTDGRRYASSLFCRSSPRDADVARRCRDGATVVVDGIFMDGFIFGC